MVILDGINYKKIDVGLKYNAGSKARDDINTILDLKTIYCIDHDGRKLSKLWQVIQTNKVIKKNQIFIQYPLKINSVYQAFIHYNDNDICLIHDVNGLRENDQKKIRKEIKLLNNFDVLISHNSKMSKWLKNQGYKGRLVDLEIFDYLTNAQEDNSIKISNKINIAFAGNLAKSVFLPELSDLHMPNVVWRLFGVGFNEQLKSDNIVYHGSFSPDDPPLELSKCHFGLIWDGDTINTCGGDNGEYLRYNNPHKCSLYLTMGLPVIIWDKAAMADFVKKYNCGICINSIKELNQVINEDLTGERYDVLRNNAFQISEKLRQGYFTKKAFEKAKQLLR